MRCVAVCLWLALSAIAVTGAQPAETQHVSDLDTLQAQQRVAQVALLPFVNRSGAQDAPPLVMRALRAVLEQDSIAVADSEATARVLRAQRIRNTLELNRAAVEVLREELGVRYILSGAIDGFMQGDSAAEVALSARVRDAVTQELVWANTVVVRRDLRVRLLRAGRVPRAEELAAQCARELLRDFFGERQSPMRETDAGAKGGLPCRRLVVLTLGNESAAPFAGHILADELLAFVMRRGLSVVDPGRVTELMFEMQTLMQGEMSLPLLRKCREELGADYVLTGTVNEFRAVPEGEPMVSFDIRLTDTQRGVVVWSRRYAQEGRAFAWLFQLGAVRGLTGLSTRLAHRVARDLPLVPASAEATSHVAGDL